MQKVKMSPMGKLEGKLMAYFIDVHLFLDTELTLYHL